MARSLNKAARRWWAWWLQERNRRRRAGGGSEPGGGPDSLLNGLLEFYKPVPSVTRLVSTTESGGAVQNFTVAAASATSHASGTYSGETLAYRYMPYKIVGGVKTLLGLGIGNDAVVTDGTNNAVLLPAPVVTGGTVDGVYVMRINHTFGEYHHRDIGIEQFPVIDLGTLWNDGFWFDVFTPPKQQGLLWAKRPYESSNPETIHTTLSPLGGWSFDSSAWQELTNYCRVDLVRRPQMTLSLWFRPGDAEGAYMSAVRGMSSSGRFNVMCTCDGGAAMLELSLADALVSFEDHQEGDWYLVTVSTDDYWENGWLVRLVVKRLRDGAMRSATGVDNLSGFLVAANEESDPYDGLMSALTSIGGSGHWGSKVPGFYDRIGLWSRILTTDEIERLYGVGLGWAPA